MRKYENTVVGKRRRRLKSMRIFYTQYTRETVGRLMTLLHDDRLSSNNISLY